MFGYGWPVRAWELDALSVRSISSSRWRPRTSSSPFHGHWLAGHLPGARAELRPGEGHLSITLSSYGEILEDLLEG